jgi:hypothetical protein
MTAGESDSRRPRKAVGPARPAYLDHGDVDRVMSVLLALVSEVASIRDRLDTHERLALAGQAATPDAIEAYAPENAVEQQREDWRDGYIRRLFRVLMEDVEGLQAGTGNSATDPD